MLTVVVVVWVIDVITEIIVATIPVVVILGFAVVVPAPLTMPNELRYFRVGMHQNQYAHNKG